MSYRLIILLLLSGAVVAQPAQPPEQSAAQQSTTQQASAEQPNRLQKLSPAVREIDRDWQTFSQLSCQQLGEIVAHSATEQALLVKRKRQCVKRYEAFLPQPVDR
jgi:hypothetical protein